MKSIIKIYDPDSGKRYKVVLKFENPETIRIDLAFSFGEGSLIPEDNQLKTVPNAFRIRKNPFQNKHQRARTIPGGDFYTSEISIGVPNGMAYMAMSKKNIYLVRLANLFNVLLRTRSGQNPTKNLLSRFIKKGPDEHALQLPGIAWKITGKADTRRLPCY